MSIVSVSATPDPLPHSLAHRNYTRKALRTVERILDAGIAVLADQGFNRLSTARVADRLRISNGNVTYYFPNKRALAEAIAERFIDAFEAELAESAGLLPDDARARFLAAIDIFVDDVRRGEYRGFLLQVWAAASWNETAALMRERISAAMLRHLQAHVGALRPELEPAAREHLALSLVSLLDGLHATYDARPLLRDDEAFALTVPATALAMAQADSAISQASGS